MAKVKLSPQALTDLESIDLYRHAHFSQAAADRYMDGFDAIFGRLAEYPEFGAWHSQVDPPIRCLSYRSHCLYYDFHEDVVTILRVLHQAMAADSSLN